MYTVRNFINRKYSFDHAYAQRPANGKLATYFKKSQQTSESVRINAR